VTAFVFTLAVAVPIVFGLHYGVPALAKVWFRRRFLARIHRNGYLCLTFDDGPSPSVTPAVLDILATAGVKATFCVSGRQADRCPDLVRRMTAAGHQVAAHGYDHRHPWRSWPGRCLGDLRRGESVVDRLVGPGAARFVRPPYGKLDLWMLIDLLRRRCVFVYWSIDPAVDSTADSKAILARLAGHLRPGEVILLHDGADYTGRQSDDLPKALTVILAEMARLDIPTATVATALSTKGRA
jgi:peptidoglycan/xylan/chitin deacetylase (PgdA/CDA1 family)